MTNRILTAVSWGHRRATAPLVALSSAFVERQPDAAITWQERPLASFEHQGIAEICAQADLVIFDHPFCGDIVEAGCMISCGELLGETHPSLRSAAYVGPTLESYRYDDSIWGAPVDAATQHALFRGDLLAPDEVPLSWDEVLSLAREQKARGRHVAMAFAGPHAILAVGAMMTNAGRPWQSQPQGRVAIDEQTLCAALDVLRELAVLGPPEALGWNSIAVHDAISTRQDIVYVPCVYGFATYGESDMKNRISFAGQPAFGGAAGAGSLIGGAAIGVSSTCRDVDLASDFVAFCLDGKTQSRALGRHHGQPAVVEGWQDAELDSRFNGYFSAVRQAMTNCVVRPRCPGYPEFQSRAGRLATDAVAGAIPIERAAARICELADALNAGP